MNYNTGDYTERRAERSTLEEDHHYRYSLSSVKKRPQFPRKAFNLAPLNLKQIKKELEEADLAESESKPIPDEKDTKEATEFSTENNVLEDVSNDLNHQEILKNESQISSEIVNTNKSRNTLCRTLTKLHFESEKENKILMLRNSSRNPINDDVVSMKAQNNDSFDLDFSTLSLQTPVKIVHQPSITPKICQDKIGTLNMHPIKIQSTMPKNQFVTPRITRMSTTRTTTPFINEKKSAPGSVTKNIICSIPKSLPEDESFKTIVVNNNGYLILNLLGRGGSSEVYQCYCLENKLLVAMKCVSLRDETSAEGYINEVKLLKKLQKCDKIIKMYDYEVVRSQKKLYVVLERGGEDLSIILKKLSQQSSHLPVYILLFYWMNMLHAVKQIHSHGVIHSDLKPANFINTDDGLKLIDFGIASAVQNDETSVIKTRSEGSCNYISPEALNCDTSGECGSSSNVGKYKVHYKSDVWSLGCILYQLVYRKTPFHQFSHIYSKLAYILNPNHKIEYPDASWAPPKLLTTISDCLRYNVTSRPSVDQLISEYEQMMLNL